MGSEREFCWNFQLRKDKLETIRSVGANVLALWSKEEIGNTGWRTGEDRLAYT